MLKLQTRSRYSLCPSLPTARAIGVAVLLVAAALNAPGVRAADDVAEVAPPPAALQIAPPETGVASYYAKRFEGRRTASGRTFRNSELMAAHQSHPFGTLVRVTNLDRGSFVDVRIADRGGFGNGRGVSDTIIDLSQAAASRLDMLTGGRARVLVEVLEWGKHQRAQRNETRRKLRSRD